jgi:hypothetical protein
VSPRLPIDNAAQGTLGDAVLSGDVALLCTSGDALPHLSDLGLCQLCAGVACTQSGSRQSFEVNDPRPTLAAHVGHVFSVRSEEQMVRADARRIVTAMANLKSGWDWLTARLFVGPSVRPDRTAFGSDAKTTVATRLHRASGPAPTAIGFVGFVDVRPEAGDGIGDTMPTHRVLQSLGARPRQCATAVGASSRQLYLVSSSGGDQ